MLKLFDNVKALAFVRNRRSITRMSSSGSERCELVAPLTAEDPVEACMTAVGQELFRYILTCWNIA